MDRALHCGSAACGPLTPIAFVTVAVFALGGCVRLGPDFVPPATTVQERWIEADGTRARSETPNYRDWWTVFNDPMLNSLIDAAYRQNLTLGEAGVRVLQARAALGIAIGNEYPQVQQAFGDLSRQRTSERGPTFRPGVDPDFIVDQLGLQASWELDFWGRFRRAVESADASFLASIANYNAALVSLTADVASSYVDLRTVEERLRIARDNVAIQQESLNIAEARFRGGATSERDVQQARTQLESTRALIPQLEASLRQARNALSVLLGRPPQALDGVLAEAGSIPIAPTDIAVGIPTDLLRRRPDVVLAELQAAAQSAQIGVAKADLYPQILLDGTFGLQASDVGKFALVDVFDWRSRTWSFGPSLQWNILNYGQITNNVRVEDARFQALLVTYQNTVLQAQREVEDGLVAFLRAQDRVDFLNRAVDAARRTVDLSVIQYREGATDYTTVLTAQQSLLDQQNNLALSRGDIPQGLISVYRALGGGWQIHEGEDFVPADVKEAMAKRTDWGRLLEPAALQPPTPQQREALFRAPDW